MSKPRHPKSTLALAREDVRRAADEFFDYVTYPGCSEALKAEHAWSLAKAALKLHLLEKGARAAKRGAR